jgi:ABC-type multidrug transport system fused ATPase/permease subunit
VIDISIGTLINICVFLILYISIGLSRAGQLGVGDFVLVLGFVSSFYPRLFDLVWGFREVGKNYADVERYFGLLNFKVKVKDPKSPKNLDKVAGEIDYDGVSFTYEGSKKQALRNVNLKIRQGQSVALVGRSGSGKTTLVKLLMRFYDLDSGRIRIDGVDISELSKSNLRSFIGVVPQEPVLFNNTIGYNICYGKEKVTKKEMVAAAKIANLHKFIVSLPKKYKTNVGERGIKLSGGQKQRLAIARMILSDPEIIVFDEATSQLDSENEKLIQSSLWKAAKNKTTIIIAHRLSTAMRADKIIVMERGEIVERGSHNEFLMKGDSLYKHFWDLQVNPD